MNAHKMVSFLSALCSAIVVFLSSSRVHYLNTTVCLKNSMQRKTVSLMKSSSSTFQFYATRTKFSFILSNTIPFL